MKEGTCLCSEGHVCSSHSAHKKVTNTDSMLIQKKSGDAYQSICVREYMTMNESVTVQIKKCLFERVVSPPT